MEKLCLKTEESSTVREDSEIISAPAVSPPRSFSNGHTLPAVIFLLTFFMLLRLFCIARIPVSGDEAYYWHWSRYLAWGYYDHPPMIAWLIALCELLGKGPLFVRLGAVLCGLGSGIFIYLLCRELNLKGGTAFLVMLIFFLLPNLTVQSANMTPDAPLLLFWSAFLYCVARAVFANRLFFWYLAGVFLGLAILSKLMALFLYPSLFLFLFLHRRGRDLVFTPHVWLCFLISIIVASPFLYWNFINDWEPFRFQLLSRHANHYPFNPGLWLQFIALQAAAASPLLFAAVPLALGWALYAGVRLRRDDLLFVSSFSLPILIFFTLASPWEHVEVCWSVAGYLSTSVGIALLVEYLAYHGGRTFKFIAILALALAALESGLLYAAAIRPQIIWKVCAYFYPRGEENFPGNGLTEIYAYEEASRGICDLQDEMGKERQTFLLADCYTLACSLTYHGGRYVHHFYRNLHAKECLKREDYAPLKGQDAIYIDRWPLDERPDVQKILRANFESLEVQPPLRFSRDGVTILVLHPVKCRNFKYGYEFLPHERRKKKRWNQALVRSW